MRVLVTGGRGLLGSDICAACRAAGHETHASGSREFDIADSAQTRQAVAALQPDLVVHSAAYTDVDGCERDPEQAFRINRDGASNIAGACLAVNAVLIAISTDFVFDGVKNAPYVETDATNPLGVYGQSKRAGEEQIEKSGARYKIVRTSWLFGANGKCFPSTIVNALAASRPLRVVRDQIGVPSYTRDIAEALVKLAAHENAVGIFHIANSGACSWYEYACEIVRRIGQPESMVTPIAASEWPSPTRRPAYSVLEPSHWRALGHTPLRPWQEALAEFLQSTTLT